MKVKIVPDGEGGQRIYLVNLAGEESRITIDQAELIARAARIVREVEAFREGVEATE